MTFQPQTFQPHGSKIGVWGLGLKGPGLKLGVEKSRVEMSFNRMGPRTLLNCFTSEMSVFKTKQLRIVLGCVLEQKKNCSKPILHSF